MRRREKNKGPIKCDQPARHEQTSCDDKDEARVRRKVLVYPTPRRTWIGGGGFDNTREEVDDMKLAEEGCTIACVRPS